MLTGLSTLSLHAGQQPDPVTGARAGRPASGNVGDGHRVNLTGHGASFANSLSPDGAEARAQHQF